MGVAIGLGVGVGLLLIWSAFVVPLAPRTAQEGRLHDLLVRAGLGGVSPASFVALCAVCGGFATVAVLLLSRTATVAFAFGVMGAYLPISVTRGRALRRQRELAEVWPEAVDNLTSAVRAGMSLPEAVAGLAQRGPEPLREPFAGFALDYQVTGRFGDSLDRLKERLADPVGDRVVEGLRVAREVGGGDLGRLLRSLSTYLREDARTRSELEARQTWTVNGARLATDVHRNVRSAIIDAWTNRETSSTDARAIARTARRSSPRRWRINCNRVAITPRPAAASWSESSPTTASPVF